SATPPRVSRTWRWVGTTAAHSTQRRRSRNPAKKSGSTRDRTAPHAHARRAPLARDTLRCAALGDHGHRSDATAEVVWPRRGAEKHGHQLGTALHAEFLIERRDVVMQGALAQSHGGGDLLLHFATQQMVQGFALTAGQRAARVDQA